MFEREPKPLECQVGPKRRVAHGHRSDRTPSSGTGPTDGHRDCSCRSDVPIQGRSVGQVVRSSSKAERLRKRGAPDDPDGHLDSEGPRPLAPTKLTDLACQLEYPRQRCVESELNRVRGQLVLQAFEAQDIRPGEDRGSCRNDCPSSRVFCAVCGTAFSVSPTGRARPSSGSQPTANRWPTSGDTLHRKTHVHP